MALLPTNAALPRGSAARGVWSGSGGSRYLGPNRIGRSELNYGEHRSIGHTLAQIESVTLDEVNTVARRVQAGPYGAAVMVSYQTKRELPHPTLRTL